MPVHQVNDEFFFRLLYDCIRGACVGNGGFSRLTALAAEWWVWLSWLCYFIALISLGVIVYCLIRIYELRKREQEVYGPIHVAKEEGPRNPRWAHIQRLMQSPSQNDWRQAIIEADILLDDLLSVQGYHGASVGEKLKQVQSSDLDSLHDAWQAHDVRNQIAHQGSAYDLSQTLAQRTVGRYEQVFRELDAI